MCDREKLNVILKEAYKGLEKIFEGKLEAVILYGSYARGDYDEESDIDIMALVDFDKAELAKYRRKVSEFACDIDIEYDVLLSVKLQDKVTFEKYKSALPYYINVAREGVEIVA